MDIIRRYPLHSRTAVSVLVLIAIFVAICIEVIMHSQRNELSGLLIDLELSRPDPRRYETLQDILTNKVSSDQENVRGVAITVRYIHFTEVSELSLTRREVDFIVLSPQATPWHVYAREKAVELDRFKRILIRAIMDERIPVLGICGGHQLLALSFGGTVGFIDKGLEVLKPDTYPRDGMAERGDVILETLGIDPLFQGLVTHPGKFLVSESHYEEVKTIPESFVNLARSEMSEIQVLHLPDRLVYGLAFHPERGWEQSSEAPGTPPAGKMLLANFFAMVLQEKTDRQENPLRNLISQSRGNGE